MSVTNSRQTPYGGRHNCLAWCLFLKENWPPNADFSTAKHYRIDLMKKWGDADQDFRDIYIQRARDEQISEDDVDIYHPDIPLEDYRRKLERYPCIRTHFHPTYANVWEKLELFLKLDWSLSPLHESELPPIVNIQEAFHVEEYTRRFILDEANFRMMGRSDTGQPVFYYHIIMIVDEQSFHDGTLLHVDFNRSGDPAVSFRYPTIHSYLPWEMHHHSHLQLGRINQYFQDAGGLPDCMDLTRSAVDIIEAEMRLRGVRGEGVEIRQLAHEAVSTVNPSLINHEA